MQKEITFRRLVVEALPEMWTFQILAVILLAIPASLLMLLIDWIAEIGEIITTANLRTFLLSWRFPVIFFLGIVLVLVYLTIELLAQIYLTDCILTGRRAGTIRCVINGFRSLKRFLNPAGIGIIVFIVIAVPLCGVGFSISLSDSFKIPNFIMDVVYKNPLYSAGYAALILFLIWTAYRSAFALHAVLIDKMTPPEAKKYSSRLVKEHRGEFLLSVILTVVVMFAIIFGSSLLLGHLPDLLLGSWGEKLPKGYTIDFTRIMKEGWNSLSDVEKDILVYRMLAAFVVLVEKYLVSIVALLAGAYFMLRLNRYYLDYSKRGSKLWPERPKKSRYIWKIVLILFVFVLFGLVSVLLGLFYNGFVAREEPVKIIAHRAGGKMAPENSVEGLKKAIEHGCYGSEIDVQRTKDGHYIINHDNNFRRLTGVNKAPEDLTMDEIRELRIRDTTGSGQDVPVATLEEMLDVIKGKMKLFVELKGPTADRQMADDVVRIIREHDCVEDTALISLKYDLINYTETSYPEFETGTLFFASLGDTSKLNCDLLIMEEDTATESNISSIHEGGKQAIVWTVNTEDGMFDFLDSEIDAVITDEILLAEEVQAKLDDRTDLQVMKDKLVID